MWSAPALTEANSPDGGVAWPSSLPKAPSLDPQHWTEPSALIPQVWYPQALTEANSTCADLASPSAVNPRACPVMETTLTLFHPERRLEGDSAFQMAGEPREFPSAGTSWKEESGWTALSCLLPGSGGRSCPGATILGSQDKKGQAPEPHNDAPDKDNIQPISNGGA